MIRVYLLFGLDSRRSDKNGTQQACVALVVHFLSTPIRSVIISGGAVLCSKRK